MPLVAVVFGWPAVVVSISLTLAGIAVSRWPLVFTGATVGSPFLFYLCLTPRFRTIALVVAVLYFSAVYAMARGRRLVAVILVVPFIALATVVARLVLAQYS